MNSNEIKKAVEYCMISRKGRKIKEKITKRKKSTRLMIEEKIDELNFKKAHF